ncbi:MAG: toll/interleukin-1 receptor domain-containing protein [Xanthomonadaceae bacterium]|nr:toll/interleukin-1 receptor domain-containing protein [Xanthomonadaceae bacterium]
MSVDPAGSNAPPQSVPRVFLSFAYEDQEVAKAIAEKFHEAGIHTWFAEWEIYFGDSLRRKIDEGLGSSNQFVVLLSEASIKKPWVNQELDGAFVLYLEGKMRLVPLRMKLAVSDLPPLLRGMNSPIVDAESIDVAQLINDLNGLTRRPPPSPRSSARAQNFIAPGFSPAAMAVAKVFVENSKAGRGFDPQYSPDELTKLTGLTAPDVRDVIHELDGFLTFHEYTGGATVRPAPTLFAEFDAFWQPWKPEQDALALAADLANDPAFPSSPAAIAARYQWLPRRLNPAMTYLISQGAVKVSEGGMAGEYVVFRILATDATRRFVKSRQA